MGKIIITVSDDAEDWQIDNLIEAIEQNDCPYDDLEQVDFEEYHGQ